MKTDFTRYGNLTPEELNAALAATGSAYRVPQHGASGSWGEPQHLAAAPTPAPITGGLGPIFMPAPQHGASGSWGTPGDNMAPAPVAEPQEPPAPVEVAPSPDQAPPPPVPRPGPSPMRKFAQGVRTQAAEAQATEDMARQNLDESTAQAARVQEERAAQIEEANARQLDLRKQQAAEAEALGARMQRQQEAADAEKKAAFDAYKQANAQAAQVQIKDSRTTAQRVLGAVALVGAGIANGYSGAAAALAGGQKTDYLQKVLTTIETGIQKDLETQRLNAQGKRDAASAARDEWQIAGQFARDKQEQAQLAESMLWRKHAAALDAEAQREKNADNAAVFRYSAAESRMNADKLYYGIEAQRAEKAKDRLNAVEAAQAQAASRGGMSAMDKLKAEEQALKNEKLRRELGGSGGGGGEADIPGYRRTKEVSTTVATQAATIESLRAAQVADLQRLEAIRQRNKGQVGWSGADAREAALIKSNLADRASQLAGGGQAGEAAKAQINDLVPDPTDVAITSDPSALYRQAIGMTNQNARARLKTYGYTSEEDETAALTSSGFVGGGNQ